MTVILIVVSLIVGIMSILAAGMFNGRMDRVSFVYSLSKYKDPNRYSALWYNPKNSWVLKHTPNYWEALAATHIKPKLLFKIVLWYKKRIGNVPDAFSDFWHYQKFKMLFSLLLSSACFVVSISLISTTLLESIIGALIVFALMSLLWNIGFNYYYNKKS